ncbi:hypothetical protein GCK32_012681 [Trichostrongylus colubriformis]|uniref:Uncharacterized protein n=1 Tax=Trichostrongylus colubriformis TaxID=6319 RepID=A0AAN8IIR9_TRICO
MYLVLLMCVLDQIQGFSRNQKPTTPFQAPKPEKSPYGDWPPESSRIISQMSEVMFGYNSMELIKIKPDVRTAIANPDWWTSCCTNSTRARVLEG